MLREIGVAAAVVCSLGSFQIQAKEAAPAAEVKPAKTAEERAAEKAAREAAKAEAMLMKFDKDGDGSVSKEEFIEAKAGAEGAAEEFAKRDTDANGRLSAAELVAKLPRAPKAEAGEVGIKVQVPGDAEGGM